MPASGLKPGGEQMLAAKVAVKLIHRQHTTWRVAAVGESVAEREA